jgi:hypothetical protein
VRSSVALVEVRLTGRYDRDPQWAEWVTSMAGGVTPLVLFEVQVLWLAWAV